MRNCGVLCIAAAALLLSAHGGSATTIVIDQGGSGDYAEIKPGLIAATPGDTVLVMPGVYSGIDNTNLDFFGRAVVLRSHAGPATTIIDGAGADRAFVFDDGETAATIVDGLTLRNCSADYGGAVYCFQSSPTIRNCYFDSNYGVFRGAGIYLSGSPATVVECYFSGASMSSIGQGGGICCEFASNATIESCSFDGNSANIGAAVSWLGGSAGTMVDCHITDNTDGCAIYCDNSSPSFAQCTFSGNRGQYAGAVYLYESTSQFIECDLYSNTTAARYTGAGGIYCDTADPVLLNCTFSDNDVGDGGGTIYCRDGSPQLMNCIIAFDGSGPAIAEYIGLTNAPQLSCCDVYGNTGGDWVGLIAGQAGLDNNMNIDPEFCDRPLGDLRLYDTSPCTADNNPACGQVGALGIGCGSPVESVSWGQIKALYR